MFFELQVTNDKKDFEHLNEDAKRTNRHIGDFNMKNYDYDTFQVAEDYEFSVDNSNIIHIDQSSQKEFIKISIYADKNEEANSIAIIALY